LAGITIYPDSRSLVEGAAGRIAELASRSVAERGRFTIALSGGATPRPVYARIAEDDLAGRIDWPSVHVFFGDERCVPPDDERSNYRMAGEALLATVALPRDNVHRIHGEDDPAQAALACEQEMQRLFRTSQTPALDLILLGMGGDGHAASLFPGTAALRERERWVVPQYVGALAVWRVTFTAALINAARHIIFLVEGAGKAETLWRVLEGPYEPDVLPAQLIQPVAGELHWLVDAPAAARLRPGRWA